MADEELAGLLQETEEIGATTLNKLDTQRNQLSQTQRRANEVHEFTLETREAVHELTKRRKRRRVMLWSIIIAQLLVIAGLCSRLRTHDGSLY